MRMFREYNRSRLNPAYAATNDTGIVGIYGHGASRTIYIESGKTDRVITEYHISFPDDFFGFPASDAASKWQITSVTDSVETTLSIAALKINSHTAAEFQLSTGEIDLFKNKLDASTGQDYILNGEQDFAIKKALEEIGRTIEFPRQSTCTFL